MFKSKVEKIYEKHDQSRVCQGDILRDFSFRIVDKNNKVNEIFLPYLIIITQDCDLEQGHIFDSVNESDNFNQFLPNILCLYAFPADIARDGNHLKEFSIHSDKINSDRWRIIRRNGNERYHFLNENLDMQIPDLLIDFKLYSSVPSNTIVAKYRENYLATVNELYREDLSQRFSNYLSRIALPVIEESTK